MPDILLIQPPIRDFYLTSKRTMPYGLARIGAHLSRAGFSVEIYDALSSSKARPKPWPLEMEYLKPFYGQKDLSPFSLFHQFFHFGYSFSHLASFIEKSDSFLVGISSLFTPYAAEALKTAEMVKRLLPKAKVVMGGHHPTAMPGEVMACSAVDFVIRGQGERAMVQLAIALKNKSRLEKVPGIVFRRKENLFISGPEGADRSISRLLPAQDLIRHKSYARKKKNSITISASRGCPMSCSYCCLARNDFWPYARRTVKDVLAEIDDAASRLDPGFIDFEDENLSLDRDWFLELLDGIHERFGPDGPELRAMNGLFPASLDEEVIQAMKKAGFTTLNLSLGSLSKEQLSRFHRPQMAHRFDEALALAAFFGMNAVGYVVAGAPGQRAEESLDDLAYLARRPVLGAVSIYYPAPMSRDFQLCREKNLLPRSFSLYRSSALPISDTTTRLEAVTLLRLSRLVGFVKALSEKDISLPPARKCPSETMSPPDNRMEAGLALLSFFRHDGILRGVTDSGRLFPHRVSKNLVESFRKKVPLSSVLPPRSIG